MRVSLAGSTAVDALLTRIGTGASIVSQSVSANCVLRASAGQVIKASFINPGTGSITIASGAYTYLSIEKI